MNHAYFPGTGPDNRFEYYAFGNCGYWSYANALMNNRLELEPGIQPDLNGYKNGLNVGIASSRVINWWQPYADLGNAGREDVGPMYAALNNLSKFDVAVIMGGTNDVAGNISAATVVDKLKQAVTEIASQGKWVFLMTLCPRTTDLLQGYTVQKQRELCERIQTINTMLRAFVATNPPNVWLVDYYDDLVGPNGIDPAGLQSSTTSATAASVLGNYRTDAPEIVYFHDGLHPGPAGAYIMGKRLAEKMILAGIPSKEANKLGPLSEGVNLVPNQNFTVTTSRPNNGLSAVLGRSIGLGPALTDSTHAAGPSQYHNVGLGYQHGQVPDYWFVYRSSNNDGESYSNFGEYTWSDLAAEYPQVGAYTNDSIWPIGSLKSSIVTVDGVRCIKVEFSTPRTGTRNEAFVVQCFVPEGQHGPWDDYNSGNVVVPNTKYVAGDRIAGSAELIMSNTSSMVAWRTAVDILAVNPQDGNTNGAKRSSLGMSQSFWPPSNINRVRMHPEDKTMFIRTPVVEVPSMQPSEVRRYVRLAFQFSFDAKDQPASGTIIIKNPAVRKITGSL
jgi:lysophospholipase L1-like esterase